MYISTKRDSLDNAVKIAELNLSNYSEESPRISIGNGKKYLLIEWIGPGDHSEIIVVDEDGVIITDSIWNSAVKEIVDEIRVNPGCCFSYQFEKWLNNNQFTVIVYREGTSSKFRSTIDASTGKPKGSPEKINL